MATSTDDPRVSVEILVIGGGITGLWLAWRYALRRYHVLCLRLSDEETPTSETLRNQGWLQSGGRYFRAMTSLVAQLESKLSRPGPTPEERHDLDLKLATARDLRNSAVDMHYSAAEMRREFGIPLEKSSHQGIVRLREDDDWSQEMLRGQVDGNLSIPELGASGLELGIAESRLGPLYDPSGSYLATSERPFEEDRILATIRQKAQATRRTRIQVVDRPVALAWDDGDPLTADCVVSDGTRIRANRVFIAAGAGTAGLLTDLGSHGLLAIRKTPLLVGPIPGQMAGLVLDERLRRFTLVGHQTADDCVGVVGVGPLEGDRPMDEKLSETQTGRLQVYGDGSRRVSRGIVARAQKRVEDVFLASPRVTAGYEPVAEQEADWQSWIHVPKSRSNVVAVLPGRATFAPGVAGQCEECDFGDERWPVAPLALPHPDRSYRWPALPGVPWGQSPRMHHHSCYNHMNDVEV